MNHDAILERLKKLLRMKRGGTPEEIATALRLAQQIADEHGINLDSLNPDDEGSSKIGHESGPWKSRLSWEEKYSAMIVDAHFKVSTFINEQFNWKTEHTITFVGTELDRKIAVYVFAFLVGHSRREWNRRSGRIRNRQAFMYGIYLGLNSKLRQQRSTPVPDSALPAVRLKKDAEIQRYIEAEFGRLKGVEIVPDTKATAAMNQGWTVGRNTEIRPAVETAGVRGHLPAQTEGGE